MPSNIQLPRGQVFSITMPLVMFFDACEHCAPRTAPIAWRFRAELALFRLAQSFSEPLRPASAAC